MALAEMLLEIFRNYYPLLAFLSGLFAGDLMLLLGILSGAGNINLFLIILAGLAGGVIHDTCLYFISNSIFARYVKKKLKLSGKRSKIVRFIEKISNGNYFFLLLIAKFVYGIRTTVTLYIAHNNKKFRKYLGIVSSTELIWITITVSVGWLAGRGFTSLIKLFRGMERILVILFFGAILIYLLHKFVISVILRKIKKLS